MKVFLATIEGISPYSQSRGFRAKKNTGETPDAFEERTWRERIHADEDGEAFIPGTAFKNCLSEVAKYLSESVPGKGKATYTKHFEAGLLVPDAVPLGVKKADVECEELFLNADGRRGGGKRVWKKYPVFRKWGGTVRIMAFDPVLCDKPDKIREYLTHAGQFIGIGRFRPRNNGYYGRFRVTGFREE